MGTWAPDIKAPGVDTIFHLLALAVLAAGLSWFACEDVRLLMGRVGHAQGRVIGHRRAPSDEGGDVYFARVLFEAEHGQTVSFEDYVGKPKPEPPEGTACAITYSRRQPSRARIRRPLFRASIYVGLVGAGVLVALSGLGVIR